MQVKTKIAVLGVDPGEILEGIINDIAHHKLLANISAVITPLKDCSLIETAEKFQIPTEFVSLPSPSKSLGFYDKPLYHAIEKYQVDLIILIGYSRILSAPFVKLYPKKIMNLHGSLLPKYRGLIGIETQKAVIASGDRQTGCTIHWVTEEVDAGPIIVQEICDVDPGDTPQSLRRKLIPFAIKAYIAAIKLIREENDRKALLI